MVSAEWLVSCIGAFASGRKATRGASLTLEIVERKNERAASHAVFNVTLKPSSTLAAILGCLYRRRIACY